MNAGAPITEDPTSESAAAVVDVARNSRLEML
jgi:hypothetical protein